MLLKFVPNLSTERSGREKMNTVIVEADQQIEIICLIELRFRTALGNKSEW